MSLFWINLELELEEFEAPVFKVSPMFEWERSVKRLLLEYYSAAGSVSSLFWLRKRTGGKGIENIYLSTLGYFKSGLATFSEFCVVSKSSYYFYY